MIKCTKENLTEILDYIGRDYGQCLYLYVDLLKYGFENKNVHAWLQKDQDENIRALVLQYHTGTHVFSQKLDFDPEDVANLLKDINPSMICGMQWTLEKIQKYFPNYEMELGLVGELTDLKLYDIEGCYKADSDDEIKELAELLATDEALGKPYGYEALCEQLLERYHENFGRNFIYRDKANDNKIVATASTYAEQGGVAVISGVMVDPAYRGKGLSKNVLSAICKNLKDDGFDVFSYYYIPSATAMHKSVGFEAIGHWSKLVRE